MSRSPRPLSVRFSLVGAGRLGIPLGRYLSRRPGYRLHGVACGSPASARRAVRRIGRGRPLPTAAAAVGPSSLILVCVPDREIRKVARRLAAAPIDWRGRTVLHTSGALDSTELAPLARRGAVTGSLHPLQTFPGALPVGNPFRGCPFAVEGAPSARRRAESVARALGGEPFTVSTGGKAAYHLCACLLSNYLVSLADFAFDLAAAAGGSAREWRRRFHPLMRAAVDHLAAALPEKVLTGPVSRGDLDTLRRHLHALGGSGRDLRDLHRILALRAVSLARAEGRITGRTAADMARLLRPGRRRWSR